MKFAGCYVTIDQGGRLFIERGLIKKQDENKLAKSKKGGKAASDEPGEQISEALRHDLKVYRLQVASWKSRLIPTSRSISWSFRPRRFWVRIFSSTDRR